MSGSQSPFGFALVSDTDWQAQAYNDVMWSQSPFGFALVSD